MRLREFAGDKRSRKITEAAVAAIPYAYYWLVGLLGAAGATSAINNNPELVNKFGQGLQNQNIPSADKVSQEDLDRLMRVQNPFAMMLKDTWNFVTGSDEPTQEEINQRVDDAIAAGYQRRAGEETQRILDKYKSQEFQKVDPGLIAAVNKAQTADDEDADKAKAAAGAAAGAAGIAGATAGQKQGGGQTIGGDDKTVGEPATEKPAEPTTDTDPGGTGSSAGDTSTGTGTEPVDGTPQQSGGREGEFGGTTPDKTGPDGKYDGDDLGNAPTAKPDKPATTSGTDTSGETQVGGSAEVGTSGEDTADDAGTGAIPKPETDVTTGSGAGAGTSTGAQTGAATNTATGAATNTATGAATNTAANTAVTTAPTMPPPIAQPGLNYKSKPATGDEDYIYSKHRTGKPKKVYFYPTAKDK